MERVIDVKTVWFARAPTPGQAEGDLETAEFNEGHPERARAHRPVLLPGKTPGLAEGDLETAEFNERQDPQR
jgi:hypothetical protein